LSQPIGLFGDFLEEERFGHRGDSTGLAPARQTGASIRLARSQAFARVDDVT